MKPSRNVVWMLGALIFVSGASGLVFEILWIRSLGLWFGTTHAAVTTVLASFMAGLAIGNLLFGPAADRDRTPLRSYRLLELGIGATGFGTVWLFLHGEPVLSALSGWVGDHGVARFAVVFALLLVPTTLMGGTLPFVTRALVRAGVEGRVVGWVYAANTAGAIAGAVAPDLVLVPALGMTSAGLCAALGNLLVAFAVGRLKLPGDAAEPLPPAFDGRAPSARGAGIAYLLYGVSGFTSMGYQVVWSRVLAHMSPGFAISFSVLLGVFLSALAIGSWAASGRADRSARPLAVAALCLAGTGACAVLPIAALPWWREVVAPLHALPEGAMRPTLPFLVKIAAVNAIWLQLPACLLMGAALPFLAAHCVRTGVAGRVVGRLYAVNTLAGAVGASVAGGLLLAAIGSQATILALALLSAVAGALVAWWPGPRRLAMGFAAAGLGAAVLCAALLQPADRLSTALLAREDRAETTLEVIREGSVTTVGVVTHRLHGQITHRELRTPGVSMSSTRFTARRYMGLLGHLPVFFARQPERALLICYGVGNTARSLLTHPDLERLDVVDTSREVYELSPWFAEATGSDPIEDPRVRAIVDDGRHHLLASGETYDVITSEPPPPKHAGIVNLYTREYYRAARRALRPGGVIGQWMPMFQLSDTDALGMISAMAAEFEHVAMFYGISYQWILLGSDAPLLAALDRWETRAQLAAVRADLASIAIGDAGDLVATFLQGDAALREMVADTPPLSDDRPTLQYPPVRGYPPPPPIPRGLPGTPYDVVQLVPPDQRGRLAPTRKAVELQHRLLPALPLTYLRIPEYRELVVGTRLQTALALRPGHWAVLVLLELTPAKVEAARRAVRLDAGAGPARWDLARYAYYTADYAGALRHLEQMRPEDAGTAANYWLIRGGSERALGMASARSSLLRAQQSSSAPPFREAVAGLLAGMDRPWPSQVGPLALAE